jgi:hypothetical protein
MKTHIDKLRNPNYLGGWDLQDENGKTTDIIVTIKEVKSEFVFNQKAQMEEPVLTVFFNECKPIILNATNRKTLKKVTDTSYIEEMAGKRIQLTTKRIKAFGEFHDAIRIVNVVVASAKVEVVDMQKCISILSACKTLAELGEKWTALTLKEKNTAEVLAEKERLKTVLK